MLAGDRRLVDLRPDSLHRQRDGTSLARGDVGQFQEATPVQLGAWVNSVDAEVTAQVALRASLPQHHSTGALEEVLAKVRECMEPRAFCSRNAERTSRMLELVRLRLNRADDPVAYAAAMRGHLDANGGRLASQGGIRDRRGQYSLR